MILLQIVEMIKFDKLNHFVILFVILLLFG